MEEKPTIRPLTYQEQYDYYIALCESALQLATSWSDYQQLIAQIRTKLRADPDYKELIANNFRTLKRSIVEHKPEEPDSATLEAIL